MDLLFPKYFSAHSTCENILSPFACSKATVTPKGHFMYKLRLNSTHEWYIPTSITPND